MNYICLKINKHLLRNVLAFNTILNITFNASFTAPPSYFLLSWTWYRGVVDTEEFLLPWDLIFHVLINAGSPFQVLKLDVSFSLDASWLPFLCIFTCAGVFVSIIQAFSADLTVICTNTLTPSVGYQYCFRGWKIVPLLLLHMQWLQTT